MVGNGGAWGSRAATLGGAWRRVRPPIKGIFGLLACIYVYEHVGMKFEENYQFQEFIGLIIGSLSNE